MDPRPPRPTTRSRPPHKGVTYRFATTANRDPFVEDPVKFEQQFGYRRAHAIPEKERIEIDPESFVVHEGKLQVFVERGDAAWKDITTHPVPKQ
jgi:hypothetical protein